MTIQAKKALFFYFIIKLDDSLEMITKSKELYFNALKLSYFGNLQHEIETKIAFLEILQEKINQEFLTEFNPVQKFKIEKSLSENINFNYLEKEIVFNLSLNDNSIIVNSVEYNKLIYQL